MKLDYQQLREAGAQLHIDAYNDRILILGEDCEVDPNTAEDDDEGVIAVYRLDINAMFTEILDDLAHAGIDVGELLTAAVDGAFPLLPLLQIAGEEE